MTTPVAGALIAIMTSACMVGDAVYLDGLSTYNENTGAGNSSDVNCTDDTYRVFVRDYLGNSAPASDNPCKHGNDASYRIWAYAAGEKLAPMLASYEFAIAGHNTHQGVTVEQVNAAGTLPVDSKSLLAQLDAIRPAHAGRVGVTAWRDFLYKPALDAATRIVWDQSSETMPLQWQHDVKPFEEEWLGWIERSLPTATEPGAFAIWWEYIEPAADRVTSSDDAVLRQRAANEAFLDRLVAAHPAGTFDDDGAMYQNEVTRRIAASYAASRAPSLTDELVALMPSGGGTLSYTAWSTLFGDIAKTFNSATRTEEQRAVFAQIISVRPCASGPDVQPIVDRLRTSLATAGNAPSGTPLAQVAVPVACN